MSHENRNDGFTLIEVIVVLLLLGVLGAVAVFKYNDIQTGARRKVIYAGIAEYNSRESQLWARYRLEDQDTGSDTSFDRNIYDNMDPYLDSGYSYDTPGDAGEEGDNWYYVHKSYGNADTGTPYKGYLEFQGERAYVERAPATLNNPAIWSIDSFEE